MRKKFIDYIDFEKVNNLLEGFNRSTGFVTAILDLEGNVLSRSGWRGICTDFHRINPTSSKLCTISDTELAGKLAEGEKYHFYKCLNGLVDVAVPVVIKGVHVANLFSGQFFFEKPDISFFRKQAEKYGFDEESYLEALARVPVVSQETVKKAMDFLLDMTRLISEMTFQGMELAELNKTIWESERRYSDMLSRIELISMTLDREAVITFCNDYMLKLTGWKREEILGANWFDRFIPPENNNIKEIFSGLLEDLPSCWHHENEILTRSGERRFIRWNNTVLRSTEGVIIGTASIGEDITERRRTELEREQLLAAEQAALTEANRARERLSQILERINDGFGSLDRDWNYTFVNEQLAKNVGRKRDELVGRNIWEEFPEAIGTPVHKAYLRAMNEQVAVDLEHFYQPFGRWFHHRFYPSPDGLSVFSHDITEQKIASEKIRENDSLIRIAAEKARLGGWNVNLAENRSYWSDVVAAIHEMPAGYAPLVEDGINFYAPEWRERIIKVFTDCVNDGVPYDEEMEIITRTGKRVWVRTIGEAVRDEEGRIYKIQGAFQDISEKKAAEAKNREKDLQFRKLSANVPDLIFQFTRRPDGTYCVPVASEGIVNIFGCSPDDVAEDFAPIARVIYPDDSERVIRDIEYSAEHLTYFTCEFRVLIPGRPLQWIYSRSTPEKLPDGSITWYGFNTNITYRKEAEEAIRQLNADLEQRVADRTSQLEAVNKELEAFSYSVSHDLRSPLRHINGFAEILTKNNAGQLSEEALKHLNIITGAAKKMGTLIDDLLSFSRTGRAELKKSFIRMDQVATEALSQVRSSAEDRCIEWDIAQLPEVYGDYNLLRQVLINLLDNAVKYTRPRDKALIKIGFTEEKKETIFYIKDNGVGFDMKYADKLFGVFQRLHSSSQFDGTGIGLANVQRIILRHGGRTWAEAEPDKGAVFYFSIPKETID